MKRRHWWWMAAVAGVTLMAVPAARTLAQAPAAGGADDPLADEIAQSLDEFAWTADGPGFAAGEDDDMESGGGYLGAGRGHGRGHGMGRGRGHGGGGGMGRGAGRGGMRHHAMMPRALDLTADQKQKVEDIHDRATRRNIQARADLRIAQLDLRKLMHAGTPDRREVEAQIDKVGALRTALQKAHTGVMFEVHGVLTAEQKKQLQELRDAGPGMQGRGGPGKGDRKRERLHQPETQGDAQ